MKLPTTTIAIVAIVVVVLVVVVAFFMSTSGQQMSMAQADKVIAERCISLCPMVKEKGIDFVVGLTSSEPNFVLACKVKYGLAIPNLCLRNCPSDCSITLSPQEELCKVVSAMPGTYAEVMEQCEKYAELSKYSAVEASCEECLG